MWCTKSRDETLLSQVLTDPHSPAEFRYIFYFNNYHNLKCSDFKRKFFIIESPVCLQIIMNSVRHLNAKRNPVKIARSGNVVKLFKKAINC